MWSYKATINFFNLPRMRRLRKAVETSPAYACDITDEQLLEKGENACVVSPCEFNDLINDGSIYYDYRRVFKNPSTGQLYVDHSLMLRIPYRFESIKIHRREDLMKGNINSPIKDEILKTLHFLAESSDEKIKETSLRHNFA